MTPLSAACFYRCEPGNWEAVCTTHGRRVAYDVVIRNGDCRAAQRMTDEQMRQLCVKLKMPGIMFNSIGFRGHLIRLYHAAQEEHVDALLRCSTDRADAP